RRDESENKGSHDYSSIMARTGTPASPVARHLPSDIRNCVPAGRPYRLQAYASTCSLLPSDLVRSSRPAVSLRITIDRHSPAGALGESLHAAGSIRVIVGGSAMRPAAFLNPGKMASRRLLASTLFT